MLLLLLLLGKVLLLLPQCLRLLLHLLHVLLLLAHRPAVAALHSCSICTASHTASVPAAAATAAKRHPAAADLACTVASTAVSCSTPLLCAPADPLLPGRRVAGACHSCCVLDSCCSCSCGHTAPAGAGMPGVAASGAAGLLRLLCTCVGARGGLETAVCSNTNMSTAAAAACGCCCMAAAPAFWSA
jgi:hypothetical protein